MEWRKLTKNLFKTASMTNLTIVITDPGHTRIAACTWKLLLRNQRCPQQKEPSKHPRERTAQSEAIACFKWISCITFQGLTISKTLPTNGAHQPIAQHESNKL